MSILDHAPRRVDIVEVAPRDGLQNEPTVLSTDAKVRFIDALVRAGHRHIEVTSLVRPDRVPQLADGEEVLRGVEAPPGVRLTVLVPNQRGLERALRAGARSVAVFTAATDTFSERNTGLKVDESLRTIDGVVANARREGLYVRAYVSSAFVCPFEGTVAPERALRVVEALRGFGVRAISIADTLGAADPASVDRLLDALEAASPAAGGGASPFEGIALHLHDTYQRALANVTVGLARGIREIDASAGGLGGCPFAPGAKGNLATEPLLDMLAHMGIETGIDAKLHAEAVRVLRDELERAAVRRG